MAHDKIRPAQPGDADALSALAFRSKAHWGYDDAFMEACRDELALTHDRIARDPTFLLERDGRSLGFYRLTLEPDREADIAAFFVDPAAIGSGVGRALWDHLRAEVTARNLVRITIESDPNAAGFYEAMGARRIGQVPSVSIPDRSLPLLTLSLE